MRNDIVVSTSHRRSTRNAAEVGRFKISVEALRRFCRLLKIRCNGGLVRRVCALIVYDGLISHAMPVTASLVMARDDASISAGRYVAIRGRLSLVTAISIWRD